MNGAWVSRSHRLCEGQVEVGGGNTYRRRGGRREGEDKGREVLREDEGERRGRKGLQMVVNKGVSSCAEGC